MIPIFGDFFSQLVCFKHKEGEKNVKDLIGHKILNISFLQKLTDRDWPG